MQHGVTAFKQCHKTYRKNCGNQMALFVVTSEPEQKTIEKYFGYDKEEVIVTGFSRWDVLEDRSDPAHKEILLMPTWRNWLEDISEEAFRKSEYYQRYETLLQDERLRTILERENITLNFYIHAKFRERLGNFYTEDRHIRLIPFGTVPLNQLLMSCHMLITDYSSVMFDYAVLDRPMLFFTYDLDEYRDKLRGFNIDIEKEAPGPLLYTSDEVLDAIEHLDETIENSKQRVDAFHETYIPYECENSSEKVFNMMQGK